MIIGLHTVHNDIHVALNLLLRHFFYQTYMYVPRPYLNSLSMLTYLKLRSALRCPTCCKLLTCSNSNNSFRMQLNYLSWAVCYISSRHNGKQLLLNHCICLLIWTNVGSAMPELNALGRRYASVATRTGANISRYGSDNENVLPNRHLWIQSTVGRPWTRSTTCRRKLQVCPLIIYILRNPYYIIE